MSKVIERFFSLWLCLAALIGLMLPGLGRSLTVLLVPLLMLVMFLTCLKVDLADVMEHVRQPVFIACVAGANLLALPVAMYLVARTFLSPELALGVLLLSAMPAGVSSPFFTVLTRGNVPLALVVSLTTMLLAPFTVTALLVLLAGTSVHLDTAGLFQTLLLVGVVPFLVSQVVRRRAGELVVRTKATYSSLSIAAMALVVFAVVAKGAPAILGDPLALLPQLLLLYALFIVLHLAGYMIAPWRAEEDRIALAVTRAYMNNGLAIVIGFTFLTPKVAVFMVLSEVPWSTLLGPFKYVTEHRRRAAPHEAGGIRARHVS